MSEVRFDGRVAIVTGAGRGLGREYALLLAARGAQVVVNDLGCSIAGEGADASTAHNVVDEIRQAGGVAVASFASVADRDGAASIVRTALDNFGRVDAVVNNAGIDRMAPFEEYTDHDRDLHVGVHVNGSWNVTQEAWPHMRKQGCGRVVMIISYAGLLGMAANPAYCMAKGALLGLTRSLALEGAAYGIKVNALCPAGFTRMGGQVGAGKWYEWTQKFRRAALVAPAVCWLAHEDCPTTGGLFSAQSGRMSTFFIGDSAGYVSKPEEFTIEAVRDNWERVTAREPFAVPATLIEKTAWQNKLLGVEDPDQDDYAGSFGAKTGS